MNNLKKLPLCSYGSECYRKNPDHLKKFYHPINEDKSSKDSTKPHNGKNGPQKHGFKQTTLNFKPVEKSPTTSQQDSKLDCAKINSPKAARKRNSFKNQNGPPRKRKTITPKGKTYAEVSSSEESNSEDNADVSSHSWTFAKPDKPEQGTNNSEISDESSEEPTTDCSTPAEKIKWLFMVDMPKDFYSFYDFCKSINEKSPKFALNDYGLKLVGAFDVLTGEMEPGFVKRSKALCHWRFFMDPPEMQTVLIGEKGLHFGYWRDEPKTEQPFVASNQVPDCKFQVAGPNLFSVAVNQLEGYMRQCNPFDKVKANKVLSSVKEWAKDKGFVLSDTEAMLSRKKLVVATTFHGLGIVVKVNKKNDLGYRPLLETNANLKKLCQAVINAKNEEDRENKMEHIERLVNAANIANDECDFGNGLELGIDLFCMGSKVFHSNIKHLLTTAYTLLDRPEYSKIIKAHLKNRRTNLELSVLQ